MFPIFLQNLLLVSFYSLCWKLNFHFWLPFPAGTSDFADSSPQVLPLLSGKSPLTPLACAISRANLLTFLNFFGNSCKDFLFNPIFFSIIRFCSDQIHRHIYVLIHRSSLLHTCLCRPYYTSDTILMFAYRFVVLSLTIIFIKLLYLLNIH